MKYNFDEEVQRFKTASSKWDVGEGDLPMSIADMDFKTARAIIDGIKSRAEIGAFGYTDVTDEWYYAVISWWNKKHQYTILKEDIIFSTGVIPTVSTCVNRLTNVGDNVLCLTPVYNIFFNSIINHGRHILQSKLVYENGAYSIDFDDLEEKMKHPLTTLMILCNPHNPIGKIWTKEELAKINFLAIKYGVVVLSDEIHCDLTDIDKNYVPFATVNDECLNNSVICLSASKTFNLAGLQGSVVVVHNKNLFNKVYRGLNSYEVAEPNFFVIDAMRIAFSECEEWLFELKNYLRENKKFAYEYIKKEIPSLFIVEGEATYLLWIDCSKITNNTDGLVQFLHEKTGLVVSSGSQYKGNGDKFIRINMATQRKRLIDGLERLKRGIEEYMKLC